MPLIQYREHRFGEDAVATIENAREIIEEYAEQGFTLTLRQLFYQFVARDLIPNTQRSYKRLGDVVANARMAGELDWEAIEDRTRWLRKRSAWESPEEIVRASAEQYHRDHWAGQRYRPEVWIEKDALVGVIEGVCEELDVPYFACRGYGSLSELWRAGQRFLAMRKRRVEPIVLHFGDHDPSGLDMTRDIEERLETFCGRAVDVRRLALTMDQIEEYAPPPNPAKLSDSRANGYVGAFGYESWELDALEPALIAGLIREAVGELRDFDRYVRECSRERRERSELQYAAENWRGIIAAREEPHE